MELKAAKDKYIGKTVCHMATGLRFRVYNIIQISLPGNPIEALFEDLIKPTIDFGQPTRAGIEELEIHYRIED